MSAISEFAAQQEAFNARLDAAVTDIQGDVASLKQQIADLLASAGTISPEDQAALEALNARSSEIASKLEALAAETPPPVPTEEPPVT